MSLCQNIETLAMAYLDDELVSEERRELELHILDCTSCRDHVDQERAEIASLRQALVAPPASDMLKARISRALDEEDRRIAVKHRKQWTRWLLPASSSLAAVAAIAVFVVGMQTPEPPAAQMVAKEVVRQNTRARPLEVQGAGTGRWLRENFAPIDPPQFGNQSVSLLGARLTAINGHDAAQLQYLVTQGANQFTLTAVVIADLDDGDLSGGSPIKVGQRVLHVYDVDGMPTISYVDEHRMGYTFASQRLSAQELLELVVSSDLIGRASQGR